MYLAHLNHFSFPSHKKQIGKKNPTAVMDTGTLKMSKTTLKINLINHVTCSCTLPLISEFSNDIRVQLQDLKATMINLIILTCMRMQMDC